MKVTEHIAKAKKPFASFEILPPLKGSNIVDLYDILDPLMEFKPPFINVTYHRAEFIYKKRDNGLLEKVHIRKRPGTVGICSSITHKYGVDTVPHIICGGFTKEETEDALLDLHYLGIENMLVLRGDPTKNEKVFTAEPGGHSHAIDLVRQVSNLNSGKYLEDDLKGVSTNFCMGVAGYPEKHLEAVNPTSDIDWLKAKVDAGAEYVVTQLFYDNDKYFDFVARCRAAGIQVPIIPGLKPLASKSQISMIPRVFSIDIPETLHKEVLTCKDDTAVRTVGERWCVEQSKDLIKRGAPCLHYYTMGRVDGFVRIAREVL
jgi:methylenetetrahydrofolate reductase (NADPH)